MRATKYIEKYAPSVAFVCAACVLFVFSDDVSDKFRSGGWRIDALYSAIFNWSAIQSGFVFGMYGFVVSKRDGFSAIISKSGIFQEFLTYIRRAYIFGFSLTFSSLPLMVIEPSVDPNETASYFLISAWFCLFIWTFLAFLRVAFIFGVIAATPDKPDRIPG